MFRPVNVLHFRQLRQGFQRDGALLHVTDREMHPGQRARHDYEQQHETARPQARQVKQGAESDRQHKAAEAANHAD